MRDKLQSEELQRARRHAQPVSLQLSSSLCASHWYTLPYVCMYMCVYLYACTCHSLQAINPSITGYISMCISCSSLPHTHLPLVYSFYIFHFSRSPRAPFRSQIFISHLLVQRDEFHCQQLLQCCCAYDKELKTVLEN